MLYKPVYMPSKKAKTAKQPSARLQEPGPSRPAPPSPPPSPKPHHESPPPHHPSPPSRPRPDVEEESPEPERKIPLLIAGATGGALVIPAEATRDVLAGKVDYYLVEDTGMTLFKAKHCLSALKLDCKKKHDRLLSFACIGGHQQVLENIRIKKNKGLGYRRKYLDPEVAAKGIYGD